MKANTLLLTLTVFIVTTSYAQHQGAFTGKYLQTKTVNQVDEYFGTKVSDPYRWLENDTAEETAQWVHAQNAITAAYFNRIPFREAIKKRLTTLINYEKYSAPFKEGGYTYFYKNDGLQNQSILYRQKDNAAPEVYLDPNKFSADGTTSMSGVEFTKDGSLCAYLISEGGADWNKVIVMNAHTKQIIEDTLELKYSGVSWKGNEGFYYGRVQRSATGSKLSEATTKLDLYYHQLGTHYNEDKLIFAAPEKERKLIGGYITEDEHWLVIGAYRDTYGNELYIQDITKPNAPIVPVITGFEYNTQVLYADNDKLYLVTNRNAPNSKIVVVDAATPTPENWKDLIPEQPFPLDASMAGGKIFAKYIKDAISQVIQYNLNGTKEKEIALPGPGSAGGFGAKREEKELYYLFTSYVYPSTIFKYNIETGQSEIYKKPDVRFNQDDFESKQVFYTSKDGAKIPMIITHKKGLSLNGKNPVMLYGYGGFSHSLTPNFSVANLVFMENGGVYAVPNIRGGGEYGDAWHKAGIKLNKQNVFDDFIAAAEYLVKEKFTSKEYLAISGGSNGGLLVGACMLQRPDLFRVCFPSVGVMDMLRYHKFTIGAAWSYDYGTADDNKEMFQYLYKYSPAHNVKKGTCYPATLVTTADHDDRVVPAHSFKFAAALQAAQGCGNPVLIRIESKAGHGAGKALNKMIDELADKWSFLFWNMGLDYVIAER